MKPGSNYRLCKN